MPKNCAKICSRFDGAPIAGKEMGEEKLGGNRATSWGTCLVPIDAVFRGLFGDMGVYASRGPVFEKIAFFRGSIPAPARFSLIENFPLEISKRRPDGSTEESIPHRKQKTAYFYLFPFRNGERPKSKKRELSRTLTVMKRDVVMLVAPRYVDSDLPATWWPGRTRVPSSCVHPPVGCW